MTNKETGHVPSEVVGGGDKWKGCRATDEELLIEISQGNIRREFVWSDEENRALQKIIQEGKRDQVIVKPSVGIRLTGSWLGFNTLLGGRVMVAFKEGRRIVFLQPKVAEFLRWQKE